MTTLLQKHPDYRAEVERLTKTIEYMTVYLQKARERQEIYDDRERRPANYYIGKLSLFNENHEPLIIDWRSPVAGVETGGPSR